MSRLKDKILTAALLPTLVGAGINPARADIPHTQLGPNTSQKQLEQFIAIPPGPVERLAQSVGRNATQIQTDGKAPQEAELIRERIREDVNMFKDLEKQGTNAGAYMLREWENGSHVPIAILDESRTKLYLAVGMVVEGKLLVRGLGQDDDSLKPVQMDGSTKEVCATMAERTQEAISYINKLTTPQNAK